MTIHALPWRTGGCLLLLWWLFAALAGLANHHDIIHLGWHGSAAAMIGLYLLLLLPNAVQSLGLAVLLARKPDAMLRSTSLCWLGLGLLLLFLPFYVYFEIAVQQWFFGRPWPIWSAFLRMPQATNWLVDGLFIAMTTTALVCQAHWQRSHARARSVATARHQNLSMRLALLQGQLEPSFLLASLDGIGTLVRDAERALAVRALARLSDLLRHALRASQQEDPPGFADEIAFLRNYLELQGLRLGPRLQVQWDIDEADWRDDACPPLLLYQLLEYAINQSLQAGLDPIRLQLGFARHAAGIGISVHWNQRQPDPPLLPAWPGMRQRLALQYAGLATLACSSDANGTQLLLCLPTEAA